MDNEEASGMMPSFLRAHAEIVEDHPIKFLTTTFSTP